MRLAAITQFERELIVERVKVGIAAAKQLEVKLGRPRVREEQTSQIRKLTWLGNTPRQISESLAIPNQLLPRLFGI